MRTSLSHFLLIFKGRDNSAAGAVDEEDFIQAFEDVPTVQVGQVPLALHNWATLCWGKYCRSNFKQ